MDSDFRNHQAVLLLGSNMGNRAGFLEAGIEGIAATCGTVEKQSAVYESEVWGGTGQEPYLNLALLIQTKLSATDLLLCCQKIETIQGRERQTRWGARTLDIDILFYDNETLTLPHLTVPHPLLCERRFVLTPLAQILPYYVHPQNGLTIKDLLASCKDAGGVWLWPQDRKKLE